MEFWFGWLTKPKYLLSFVDSLVFMCEIFISVIILCVLAYIIQLIRLCLITRKKKAEESK